MLDALKTLFENDVVSESVKQEIEEAWNNKVNENRQEVTSMLREEFAQKYEHDKNVMAEAIDKMVGDQLKAEMTELAEDRRQLIDAKAKYVKSLHSQGTVLKSFVNEMLKKEVTELHTDQRDMAKKFRMLEEFVVDSLAKEITEFQVDKNDLAKTKVRLVREAKTQYGKLKSNFVKKSAGKISTMVERVLKSEIGQLKEDIETARKNDFGRRLFEAFSTEYMNSYLNEKSETSKLINVVKLKDKQLDEARVKMSKAATMIDKRNSQIKRITETVSRQEIISELVEPLNKSQKTIMMDLLESVQTNRLKNSFDKYLPTVIQEETPKKSQTKATLTEGKEVTGNKKATQTNTTGVRDNVIDIRRLAGLS
jgi:hypothetical protein